MFRLDRPLVCFKERPCDTALDPQPTRSIRDSIDLVPHLTRIVLRTAGVFVLNHDLVSESEKLNTAFVDLNRRAGESLRSFAECPFAPAKKRSL